MGFIMELLLLIWICHPKKFKNTSIYLWDKIPLCVFISLIHWLSLYSILFCVTLKFCNLIFALHILRLWMDLPRLYMGVWSICPHHYYQTPTYVIRTCPYFIFYFSLLSLIFMTSLMIVIINISDILLILTFLRVLILSGYLSVVESILWTDYI